jgi:hypothetical protein
MNTRLRIRLVLSALLAVLFGILSVPDASAGTFLKAQVSASDAPAGRYFGYSVAVDDDTMVAGDPFETNTFGNPLKTYYFSGSAYVFKRSGDTWTQQAKLTPEDTLTDPGLVQGFGWSVAVSGDTIVIGTSKGFAYVFKYNGENWGIGEELSPRGSGFGWSVAINQGRVVVGARMANLAYVFCDDGSTCTPETEHALTANNASGDFFGTSVSVSGNTVAVGAPGADSVYVFRFDGTTWSEGEKLSGPPESGFGFSVAMSNDSMVVGVPDANAAYTFRFDGTKWIEEGSPLKGEDTVAGAQFGYSVTIDGDILVIGAPFGQDDSGNQTGCAYVWKYDLKAKQWKPAPTPKLSEGAAENDQLGWAVALKGNRAIVGARNAGQKGSVSEFTINRPPVASATIYPSYPSEVHEGDTVKVEGSASDPDPEDASFLTYLWVQTAGPEVGFDPTAREFEFTAPPVTADQPLTFQLTVYDGEEYSESVEVFVLVKKQDTQCQVTSHLGEKLPWIPAWDTFMFPGNTGEKVTLTLQPAPGGTTNGGQAVLILQARIPGVWFLRANRGALPNQIQATLPAAGEYLVAVINDPFCENSARFRGDYMLSLEGASGCLEPTQRCLPTKKKVELPANSRPQNDSLTEGFWF